jgi:outer membrane protein
MRRALRLATITSALLLAAGTASAAGFSVRAGYSTFNPKSDNGTVAAANASIDTSDRFTIGASYHIDDSWEVTLDSSITPYEHVVTLAGLGKVVSLEHRPISLGLNWHILGGESATFSPYVGLGWNWTSLSDVRGINALTGAPVDLDDASGPTAVLGADIKVNETFYVRGEARWIDFDTDATLGGADIGTANVDPWVWSVSAGLRF